MSSSPPESDGLIDRYNQALNKEKESFAIEALQHRDNEEIEFTDADGATDKPLKFLGSYRGQYIIAQALYYGIKALEAVDPPYQETSNLTDMKYLKETIFDLPDILFDNSIAVEEFNKLQQLQVDDDLEMASELPEEYSTSTPTTCTDDYHVVDDCTSGDQVLCNCGEAIFTNCDDPNCPC